MTVTNPPGTVIAGGPGGAGKAGATVEVDGASGSKEVKGSKFVLSGRSFNGGGGGAGGSGIDGSGATVNNGGGIAGGQGGAGGAGAAVGVTRVTGKLGVLDSEAIASALSFNGGGGGAGGSGIDGSDSTVDNSGTISGGQGGAGGAAGTLALTGVSGEVGVEGSIAAASKISFNGGDGGAGGSGIDGSDSTVDNSGTISGGQGGAGGAGATAALIDITGAVAVRNSEAGASDIFFEAGGGGAGGSGIDGNANTVSNSGVISGGQGGSGGTGVTYLKQGITVAKSFQDSRFAASNIHFDGGSGGTGGSGITGSGFSVTNAGSGAIAGGQGGRGGNGEQLGATTAVSAPTVPAAATASMPRVTVNGGDGGTGGDGIAGSDFTVINAGTITGGAGGAGGSGRAGASNGAAGAGGAGIVSTGGSSVTTSGSIAGGLSGDGKIQADAIDFSGGGNTLTLETGYSFIGNVVSTSGTADGDTLAFGGSGSFNLSELSNTTPTGWTGTPQFFGFADLAKTGGGITVLSGQGGGGGNFSVSDGTLEVGDAADANTELFDNVAVGAQGILRGHGTIIGNVTNAGDVSPGGTLGILTVNGNYVQTGGGTLSIEVTPSTVPGTGYSQLVVNGKASLAGGLAVQVDQGHYSFPTTYDIVQASGGVSGTFSSVAVTKAIATYFNTTVVYQPNNVLLEFSLDNPSIFSTGRIYVASNFAQNNAVLETLNSVSGPVSDNETDRGYWLHGVGSFGNANGYSINSKGFVIGKGFDISPDLVVGGAISNVYTATSGSDSFVRGSSAGVLAYGIYTQGPITATASVEVGHLGTSIQRTMADVGLTALGSSNGNYQGAAVHVQYALLNSGPYFVSPYGTANYLHTLMGSAQEYGAAPLNLRYDAMVTSLAQFGAGILAGYSVPVSYGELTTWASLGGIGTLGNPHIGNTETLGSFSGRENALAAPVGAFTPAAGVVLTGKGKWSTDAYWGGQFGSATSNESFGVQARYEW